MQSLRLNKIRELIKQEIGTILLTEIKDPRIGIITITDVEISPDLRYCKVFISTLGEEDEGEQVVNILNRAKGFIRHQIKKRIKIKFIPEFSFKYDPSIKRGTEVIRLIENLNKNGNT